MYGTVCEERERADCVEEPADGLMGPPKRNLKPRVQWTERETDILFELVCEQGSQWADIVRSGHLPGRGQVALKDKARNMMYGFRKEGMAVSVIEKYPKWASVTTGQEKRGVHAYHGIIPDRSRMS